MQLDNQDLEVEQVTPYGDTPSCHLILLGFLKFLKFIWRKLDNLMARPSIQLNHHSLIATRKKNPLNVGILKIKKKIQ